MRKIFCGVEANKKTEFGRKSPFLKHFPALTGFRWFFVKVPDAWA